MSILRATLLFARRILCQVTLRGYTKGRSVFVSSKISLSAYMVMGYVPIEPRSFAWLTGVVDKRHLAD